MQYNRRTKIKSEEDLDGLSAAFGIEIKASRVSKFPTSAVRSIFMKPRQSPPSFATVNPRTRTIWSCTSRPFRPIVFPMIDRTVCARIHSFSSRTCNKKRQKKRDKKKKKKRKMKRNTETEREREITFSSVFRGTIYISMAFIIFTWLLRITIARYRLRVRN